MRSFIVAAALAAGTLGFAGKADAQVVAAGFFPGGGSAWSGGYGFGYGPSFGYPGYYNTWNAPLYGGYYGGYGYGYRPYYGGYYGGYRPYYGGYSGGYRGGYARGFRR